MTRIVSGTAIVFGAENSMQIPKLPFVMVEWFDAVDWESPVALSEVASRHRPEEVVSIGWLLKEDEIGVTLACEYYDETYRRTEFIPRINIIRVNHFRLTKPPKPRSRSKVPVSLQREQVGGDNLHDKAGEA